MGPLLPQRSRNPGVGSSVTAQATRGERLWPSGPAHWPALGRGGGTGTSRRGVRHSARAPALLPASCVARGAAAGPRSALVPPPVPRGRRLTVRRGPYYVFGCFFLDLIFLKAIFPSQRFLSSVTSDGLCQCLGAPWGSTGPPAAGLGRAEGCSGQQRRIRNALRNDPGSLKTAREGPSTSVLSGEPRWCRRSSGTAEDSEAGTWRGSPQPPPPVGPTARAAGRASQCRARAPGLPRGTPPMRPARGRSSLHPSGPGCGWPEVAGLLALLLLLLTVRPCESPGLASPLPSPQPLPLRPLPGDTWCDQHCCPLLAS